jgi:hypothetical protein
MKRLVIVLITIIALVTFVREGSREPVSEPLVLEASMDGYGLP